MTDPSPHDKAADAVHEGRPVEAQYVRGGGKGRRILLILVASLSLVAICFALIYAFAADPLADTNANDGDQAVDVRAFDGDAATPPTADAPTTATGEPTNPPTGEASNINAPTVQAPPSQ